MSADADMENLSLDSTCIKVHESANGGGKTADKAVGRTRGGLIGAGGASYVIPPQSKVSEPRPVDWRLYKERHLVECFLQKLKWFRRIATRYDKLDTSFLAFVYLASIAILLI